MNNKALKCELGRAFLRDRVATVAISHGDQTARRRDFIGLQVKINVRSLTLAIW